MRKILWIYGYAYSRDNNMTFIKAFYGKKYHMNNNRINIWLIKNGFFTFIEVIKLEERR